VAAPREGDLAILVQAWQVETQDPAPV